MAEEQPAAPPAIRPPGRPRSARADRAILETTLELLATVGFGRMTVEGVAAGAGVGKTTVYRRWPSKLALVLAAVGQLAHAPLPEPATGNTRDDLVVLLRQVIQALRTTIAGRILPALIAEMPRSPELADALHDFWISRRGLLLEVLERAAARGDLEEDIDCELAADLLYGPIHYRFLISASPLDDHLPERLVDTVLKTVDPGRSGS